MIQQPEREQYPSKIQAVCFSYVHELYRHHFFCLVCALSESRGIISGLGYIKRLYVSSTIQVCLTARLCKFCFVSSYQKRALRIIYGDQIKVMPYQNALFLANLESLKDRRIKPSQSFFKKILSTDSCPYTLLPPERNNEIFSKLCDPLKYPILYSRTKKISHSSTVPLPTSRTVCDLYFIVHFIFSYCTLLIVFLLYAYCSFLHVYYRVLLIQLLCCHIEINACLVSGFVARCVRFWFTCI